MTFTVSHTTLKCCHFFKVGWKFNMNNCQDLLATRLDREVVCNTHFSTRSNDSNDI
jgi:hypothetical protein